MVSSCDLLLLSGGGGRRAPHSICIALRSIETEPFCGLICAFLLMNARTMPTNQRIGRHQSCRRASVRSRRERGGARRPPNVLLYSLFSHFSRPPAIIAANAQSDGAKRYRHETLSGMLFEPKTKLIMYIMVRSGFLWAMKLKALELEGRSLFNLSNRKRLKPDSRRNAHMQVKTRQKRRFISAYAGRAHIRQKINKNKLLVSKSIASTSGNGRIEAARDENWE